MVPTVKVTIQIQFWQIRLSVSPTYIVFIQDFQQLYCQSETTVFEDVFTQNTYT